MFHDANLVGTFCVLLASPGCIMGLYTEIYIFTGKDDCQRTCVSDPTCEMVVYSKLNITCHTSLSPHPPTADEVHIKRSQILDQSSDPPRNMKPLLETCLLKQPNAQECIREGKSDSTHELSGIFACHDPSPEDWTLATSLCIPLHRFTVLYSCSFTWGGAGFTCEQTHAWEQLDQRRKKRKIIKNLQPDDLKRLPVPFSRGRVMRICGTPHISTCFAFNFCLNRASHLLLHMNPRFYLYHEQVTIRNVVFMNHRVNGRWGGNQVQSKDFPFATDQPFVLTFMRRRKFYVVKMDNHTWKYPDMFPHHAPNRFSISQGLINTQLQIF